jgi:NAD(P)H-flavin reductase
LNRKLPPPSRKIYRQFKFRSPNLGSYREALEALKARLNLTIVHVLANPPAGWTGEQGFITAEVFKRHLPPPYADHEYFICGPDVMLDAIEKALGEMNVPLSKYHSERYSFV